MPQVRRTSFPGNLQRSIQQMHIKLFPPHLAILYYTGFPFDSMYRHGHSKASTIISSSETWQYRAPDKKGIPQASTLALFPARMREISRPRLNAWLKRRRDWKVETNGNHERIATGIKISAPIPASYILANSLTESHNPRLLTSFFHVTANCSSSKGNKGL